MGTPFLVPSDMQVIGNIVANGIITSSTAFITDSLVQAGAAISATKMIHQQQHSIQLFASATAVSAVTQLVGGVRGTTSSLVEVWAAVITAPTSSDTVHVDLQRSTGGGAFATTLAGTIAFTSSSTGKTIYTATPTATLVQGDLLEIIVTVSGSSALGLIVGFTTRESAT
jgi:hypothetical protein